jgi:hypothetical protein
MPRRRGAFSRATRTASSAKVARAALSLARGRLARLRARRARRRRIALLAGGTTLAAAAAGVALGRDRLASRLPGGEPPATGRSEDTRTAPPPSHDSAPQAASAAAEAARVGGIVGDPAQDEALAAPSPADAEHRAAEAAARADLAADEAERLRAPAGEEGTDTGPSLPDAPPAEGGGISGRGRDDESPDAPGRGA